MIFWTHCVKIYLSYKTYNPGKDRRKENGKLTISKVDGLRFSRIGYTVGRPAWDRSSQKKIYVFAKN